MRIQSKCPPVFGQPRWKFLMQNVLSNWTSGGWGISITLKSSSPFPMWAKQVGPDQPACMLLQSGLAWDETQGHEMPRVAQPHGAEHTGTHSERERVRVKCTSPTHTKFHTESTPRPWHTVLHSCTPGHIQGVPPHILLLP